MLWIGIFALVVAIDQVSKYIIKMNVKSDDIHVIGNFFLITNHVNKGAAWGVFQNGRIFFLILTPIIAIIITYIIYKTKSSFLKLSLTLILGGAIGNFIDRALYGGVTDFLDFFIGSYHFPTFNAADSFVVIGTILLAIYLLFIYKEPDKKRQ